MSCHHHQSNICTAFWCNTLLQYWDQFTAVKISDCTLLLHCIALQQSFTVALQCIAGKGFNIWSLSHSGCSSQSEPYGVFKLSPVRFTISLTGLSIITFLILIVIILSVLPTICFFARCHLSHLVPLVNSLFRQLAPPCHCRPCLAPIVSFLNASRYYYSAW